MATESTAKNAKNAKKIVCQLCAFVCSKQSNYDAHILTRKHLQSTGATPKNATSHTFSCECGKKYSDRTGLWRHKKKCIIKPVVIHEPVSENEIQNVFTNSDMIMEILKQNQDFKNMIIEQNKQNQELQKQMLELAGKAGSVTNNNTTNNNQFNLQIFLNEKCKNAMNITDFVDTVKVQPKDLEVFGTHGYCEGITRIFIRYLNELDICKRPIHCSDLKREIMYVKDKDVWEKDDERKLIKKAIDKIERKNHLIIPAWQLENPEFNQYDSKVNDVYNQLLIEAMGGETKEEIENNYNKITRSIAKGTIITKTHV